MELEKITCSIPQSNQQTGDSGEKKCLFFLELFIC